MPDATPSLYVHIPFCRSRCPYCSFASGGYEANLADAYLDALSRELSQRGVFDSISPSSIFIGGGTPSCLSLKQCEKLLRQLRFSSPVPEITCEINPDSASREKLRLLRDSGVNRCSFGVQTFSEKGLRLLGRRHNAAKARKAVETAVLLGFSEISLDLMFAWPGQDKKSFLQDLKQAVSLGITHLSCYQLTLEEDSRFYNDLSKNNIHEINADHNREFWDTAEQVLREDGFEHYETSNYCRPGHVCRHNVAIWKGGNYLGIGSAAHSHLENRRFANVSDAEKYIAALTEDRLPEVFSETLNPEAKAKECAIFWLRLFEGVEMEEFKTRTGFDFRELYAGTLPGLLERGWLEFSEGGKRIRVGEKHQPILDSILVELV